MATIKERTSKRGLPRFTAEVRRLGESYSKTFSTRKDAEKWALETEAYILDGIGLKPKTTKRVNNSNDLMNKKIDEWEDKNCKHANTAHEQAAKHIIMHAQIPDLEAALKLLQILDIYVNQRTKEWPPSLRYYLSDAIRCLQNRGTLEQAFNLRWEANRPYELRCQQLYRAVETRVKKGMTVEQASLEVAEWVHERKILLGSRKRGESYIETRIDARWQQVKESRISHIYYEYKRLKNKKPKYFFPPLD